MSHDDADDDEMLEYCSCNCSGSIVDFIDSLIEYKRRYGELTEKQRSALERTYFIQTQKDEE